MDNLSTALLSVFAVDRWLMHSIVCVFKERLQGKLVLVRLEFELKLEPLLLYSPATATAAATPAAATPPPLC